MTQNELLAARASTPRHEQLLQKKNVILYGGGALGGGIARGDVQGQPLLQMAAADFARPVTNGVLSSFITARRRPGGWSSSAPA